MQGAYGVTGVWKGGWDEAGLGRWAAMLRARLDAPEVTFGLVFITSALFDRAEELIEILRLKGQIPLLAGCSGGGVIGDSDEFEGGSEIVLALYHLPGTQMHGFHFTSEDVDEAQSGEHWHSRTGLDATEPGGWLVFASPFDLNGEAWLRTWNAAFPGVPTIGGLSSGIFSPPRTQVYLNGEVYEEGLVAVALTGDVRIETVVSQGCTPIGESWTITKAERNFILGIANRPAYSVLLETFNGLTHEEQVKSQNNLFIGIASDEYHDEFRRGDFLIRNLLNADPKNGVLAVGAQPRPGQTIQFQRRDPQTAGEELAALLADARRRIGKRVVYGGCVCLCNGRGARLFGRPGHDAGLIQEQLGPLPVVGFFGNGELGPIGNRNYLHGYTAALGVFVRKE
jgi:small ligand-binding sensory domain FIST